MKILENRGICIGLMLVLVVCGFLLGGYKGLAGATAQPNTKNEQVKSFRYLRLCSNSPREVFPLPSVFR